MWCSCLGAERSLLIMWITLQLWRFGWLPGQGGGAYQVVAGNFVGLQNLPRSRLSKPWIDSEEADRLRKEGVGISGLCGVLRLSNMRRMHSDWQVPFASWLNPPLNQVSECISVFLMGFSRWLSVAGFFALIPIIQRNGGLGVSSLLLSLIEFHGGSEEKSCCLRNSQRFWLLKVVILVVPDVSCDVSWSISCRESFFPRLILSQERIGFVGLSWI